MRRDVWELAEPAPALLAGEVHVWRVDLARVPDRSLAWLSEYERMRMERPVNRERRALHARARATLRELLGVYVGSHPAAIDFVEGHGRKPRMVGSEEVRFSVSHARALALFAFARRVELGIDVEVERSLPQTARLARRLQGEEQARRVEALDGEARRSTLRAWTRREARVKLTAGAEVARSASGLLEPEPKIVELPQPDGAFAALALETCPHIGAVVTIRRLELGGDRATSP